ncbi:type II toxin-antitoxin system RelE/ParE family toxin [Georgenia satyanarayanai]|uniref:type II toxin-antitoxin system RelE/ParE family toxin n=1 Tax=Georgenia satyanarayanai TaxID=860221 RepID=UPI00203BE8F1|nr:type II toxin-antitoxin system RelE/ParE family toxin [Georgenia satyanarayanai]MCM3662614.1 type II toxin-antitoxin system RelE/ParE family toxin [Georgenia satyanarayanai]
MATRAEWTIEYEGDAFERFFTSLTSYEQAVLTAAIEHVLMRSGIDICQSEWGKALGKGLYEFRVRRSLQAILSSAGAEVPEDVSGVDRQVLLRVFCTFHGDKIVLLLSGYDKQSDPSEKRQDREIEEARKMLTAWKAAQAAASKGKKKGAKKSSKKKRR